MNRRIQLINTYLSLIKMYLDDIENYEKGSDVRKGKINGDGYGKQRSLTLINSTIKRCNASGPIPYDELSAEARMVVGRLEEWGIHNLNISLM